MSIIVTYDGARQDSSRHLLVPLDSLLSEHSSNSPCLADYQMRNLVLTTIVIGLGVTAVMLSFAVRIYKARKTLMIDELTESKL